MCCFVFSPSPFMIWKDTERFCRENVKLPHKFRWIVVILNYNKNYNYVWEDINYIASNMFLFVVMKLYVLQVSMNAEHVSRDVLLLVSGISYINTHNSCFNCQRAACTLPIFPTTPLVRSRDHMGISILWAAAHFLLPAWSWSCCGTRVVHGTTIEEVLPKRFGQS